MQEKKLLGFSPEGFHHLFYREYGKPEFPTLIATHGLTRNSSDFHYLANHLAHRYHIFTPDIVGRGNSDRLNDATHYNFPQYLSDLTALIARTGAEKLTWIGTSMGGLLGMILAASSESYTPIKCLILNDVGPIIPKAALKRIRQYAGFQLTFKTREEAEKILRQIFKPFGIQNEIHWQHFIDHSLVQMSDGTLTLAYDPKAISTLGEDQDYPSPFVDKDGNLEFWDYWQRIKCPVLLLQGENSDILTDDIIQKMRQQGPQFDHVVIKAVGHAPSLYSEDQIRIVSEWLGTRDI